MNEAELYKKIGVVKLVGFCGSIIGLFVALSLVVLRGDVPTSEWMVKYSCFYYLGYGLFASGGSYLFCSILIEDIIFQYFKKNQKHT